MAGRWLLKADTVQLQLIKSHHRKPFYLKGLVQMINKSHFLTQYVSKTNPFEDIEILIRVNLVAHPLGVGSHIRSCNHSTG